MKRGSYLKRYTPLSPVGRKAKARRQARQLVVEYVRERDVSCQFPAIVETHRWLGDSDVSVPVYGCAGRLDVHEIAPRSAYPGGEIDVDNCVLICRRHHDWVGDNPQTAWLLGLHKYSWETAA